MLGCAAASVRFFWGRLRLGNEFARCLTGCLTLRWRQADLVRAIRKLFPHHCLSGLAIRMLEDLVNYTPCSDFRSWCAEIGAACPEPDAPKRTRVGWTDWVTGNQRGTLTSKLDVDLVVGFGIGLDALFFRRVLWRWTRSHRGTRYLLLIWAAQAVVKRFRHLHETCQ